MVYDALAVTGSYFLALWLRFDGAFSSIPRDYLMSWAHFAPIYAVLCLVVFWLLRLYRSMWQYASFSELNRTIISSAITAIAHTVLITVLFQRMPISYYIIGAGIQFLLVLSVRFSYRFILLERGKRAKSEQKKPTGRVMLIGAGAAGQMILRDLHNADELHDRVCCIIDDNSNKWGRFLDGVPIVGGRNDIFLNVEKYRIDKIFLAIPSATPAQRRDILDICKETSCELKNLPGMYQFVEGTITASAMKEVDVEDLLGREPVRVDMEQIYSFLTGKVILVTGGGGSIGSELCRQIAKNNPKQLIIFDIYENNAHAIGLELRDLYPGLNLEVLIGSVRDSRRINQVFATYKPDVVYHAAAHKHVPLMEDSPCESIKNNAIGTYKTAYAAMMNGCKRFVLISTDKAVNPTNIMGASKRLCEMIIQSFDRKLREGKAAEISPLHVHAEDTYGSMRSMARNTAELGTEFVAVRFGNVLGSNGSVIPRFKEQIAKGGPVTVTHPDIIRYFMTIPEAASLVLQAGTYADGGEIFVLDMGSPVKIDTLARNLIRLSGLTPDVDIQISYTGLRPGEKLYEEKLMGEEGLLTTPNRLIHIGQPIPFDTDTFLVRLQILMEAAYDGRNDQIRELVAELVPTYHPAGKHGSEAKGEAFEQQMRHMRETAAV
ncbi:MAG: polysaccharide biosynthesis protein [Oscillospiraceae bacterium]|nr:polysaccharide biosynthesis protein [Oscillospiraceae bacterium]MBQ9148519.1 polysaccharide biosynthesis protein [Oscillospiraceae bacterium]